MRKASRASAWGVALVSMVFLSACGQGAKQSDGPGSGDGGGEPQAGGDLVVLTDTEYKAPNFYNTYDTDQAWVFQQVFETLVVTDGTEIVPRLAESWKVSKDGTEVTFNLREGVTFHDGSDLTAEDVVFSLEAANDGGWEGPFEPINQIEALDDFTVVVTTDRPHAPLLASMAFWAASIVPADFGGVSQKEFFEQPVGTGPFTWAELESDGSLRLEKYDDYWQENLPYLDSVTYRVAPESNSRVLQLRAGEGQIVEGVDRDVRAALEGDDNFKLMSYPSTEVTYITFNHEVKPLNEASVRRALIHAMNRQGYLDAFEDPGTELAGSFMPPTDPGYTEIEPYAYDVELAKAELAKSSVPDGFSVQITIPDDSAPEAEALQQDLAKIGVEVELVVREEDTWEEELYDYDFALTTVSWYSDYLDSDQPMQYMINKDYGINAMFTGYDAPELVELVNQAATELDLEKRNELYAQVQQQAHDDAYLAPIGYAKFDAVLAQEVRGYSRSALGEARMENVWLAQ